MQAFKAMEAEVHAAPDQQISLTDPDARAMGTSGKGTAIVGYNVQTAVDAQHHLIVAHDVTNVGHDRDQLSNMAGQAKAVMGVEALDVLADRGYFKGEEVLACAPLGVTPYVPKPLTSGSKAAGRFGKQDFVYIPEEDAYRCPADQRLTWRFTSAEKGMTLHSYWTSKCAECPLKTQCTTGKEPPRSGLQSEACDRHPGCPAPDGGHAGLRPRLKSSCFSASPSKSDNRKPPAGQPSADHASAFLHSLHPLLKFNLGHYVIFCRHFHIRICSAFES